jgi:3-phosphoshikimate 1-carboxyvinyltransferase
MKKKLVFSGGFIKGDVALPSSKSISNRLLIMRYLSGREVAIAGLSGADDTRLLIKLLDDLKSGKTVFDAGNAGTVLRFMTALLSVLPGDYRLLCSERMKQRPVGGLAEALRSLGAGIAYTEKEGYPPLAIKGGGLTGNSVSVDVSQSSQFVSALLLTAPYLSGGLRIALEGNIASKPYISMTVSLMRQFGVAVEDDFGSFYVPAGGYRMTDTVVEADWSAAAFFYELAALSEGADIFLHRLTDSGLQGDAVAAGLFDYLGVQTVFENDGVRITKVRPADKNIRVDFTDYPDLALPYIVACAGEGVIGTFSGLDNLRLKESDRLKALSSQLAKFGYDFRETGYGEWVLINSCRVGENQTPLRQDIEIETFDDHRIAMAFAPLMLKTKTLTINNPDVVTKSFPSFWSEIDKVLNVK